MKNSWIKEASIKLLPIVLTSIAILVMVYSDLNHAKADIQEVKKKQEIIESQINSVNYTLLEKVNKIEVKTSKMDTKLEWIVRDMRKD